jgi:hypothetical protein
MTTVANTSTSTSSTSTSNTDSGNQQLQDAFNYALAQAQQTLQISTIGNAQLGALRARPN